MSVVWDAEQRAAIATESGDAAGVAARLFGIAAWTGVPGELVRVGRVGAGFVQPAVRAAVVSKCRPRVDGVRVHADFSRRVGESSQLGYDSGCDARGIDVRRGVGGGGCGVVAGASLSEGRGALLSAGRWVDGRPEDVVRAAARHWPSADTGARRGIRW